MQETDSCEQSSKAGIANSFLRSVYSRAIGAAGIKHSQNELRLLTNALSGRTERIQAIDALATHVQQARIRKFSHESYLTKEDSLYLMTSKNSLWARFRWSCRHARQVISCNY
jgi:hypothetical protein